jgi:tetratricopeptide (TPR) repeat protein
MASPARRVERVQLGLSTARGGRAARQRRPRLLPLVASVALLVAHWAAGPVPVRATDLDVTESVRAGRYGEAIALASARLARQPDDLVARLVRALAYYRAGRPHDALADIDQVLAHADDDGSPRALRALVALELGRYAEALADARRALASPALAPENAGAARLVAARVLLAQGQRAEAAAYLEEVVALPEPTNALAARLTLDLLRLLPPAEVVPPVQDAGDGFARLVLGEWTVEFQHEDGVAPTVALGLARLLAAQLAAVEAATGVGYRGPLRLVVYKSEWDLEQRVGGQYRGPGHGRALREGVRTAAGPWAQHLHLALTNYELLWNLTHEAVHLVQAAAGLDDAFPRAIAWLVEGHAEYVAGEVLREAAPDTARFRQQQRARVVARAAAEARLLSVPVLERFGDWARLGVGEAELAYGQAYYLAALFAERFGPAAVFTVLREQRHGAPAAVAFVAATGGLSMARFEAEARAELVARAVADAGDD